MNLRRRCWISKSTKLLAKYNTRSLRKAIEIKNKKMPQKLYQYRSIDEADGKKRLDWLINIIETGNMYCSQASQLNDPFDMRSILSSKKITSYKNLLKSPEEYKWLDAFKLLLKVTLKQNAFQKEELDEFGVQFDAIFMRQIESIYDEHSEFLSWFKIVCLTETYDNLPMWWLYADRRKGVCVEFEKQRFSEQVETFTFPVNYTHKLPDVIKTLDKVEKFQDKMSETDLYMHTLISTGIYPCLHKLADWEYEREWRYIMLNQEQVHFGKPSKIILGDMIESENKEKICIVAMAQGIEVTQIKITPYGIVEEPIK